MNTKNKNEIKEAELIQAKQVLSKLASSGNILALKLIHWSETLRTEYKQHHIQETYDGFSLVFYYSKNSASWGTHTINFQVGDIGRESTYFMKQYQHDFSEFEIQVYQNFMKDFFEILNELINDYRFRNPLNRIDTE